MAAGDKASELKGPEFRRNMAGVCFQRNIPFRSQKEMNTPRGHVP